MYQIMKMTFLWNPRLSWTVHLKYQHIATVPLIMTQLMNINSLISTYTIQMSLFWTVDCPG